MSDQAYKICPQCNQPAVLSAQQCSACGHVFRTQFTPPPDRTTMVSPPGWQAPGYGVPSPVARKSRLAAGLLGIFLGHLGVHRFYLGYTTIGVVQLLMTLVFSWVTCGITFLAAAVWGVIEGIMILTGAIACDALGNPLGD